MSIEASHTYSYSADGKVDHATLLDVTQETLEQYDAAYSSDKASYFERLEEAARFKFQGIPHVHARREGDSRSEAVMVHAHWSTPVVPGNSAQEFADLVNNPLSPRPEGLDSNRATRVIQADFLHSVLREAGVTDAEGNFLSVVVLPSPSLDRRGIGGEFAEQDTNLLTRLEKLGYIATEFLDRKDFGFVHLSGVSQGSSVSSEVIKSGARGIEILSSMHGETPMKRLLPMFAKNYFTDKSADWQMGGPLPRTEIARGDDENKEGYNWANVYGNRNLWLNLMLAREMSKQGIDELLHEADRRNIPLTFERGALSKVSAGLEAGLEAHPATRRMLDRGVLQLLIAKEFAPHSHTENIVGTVDMTVRSILFGKATQAKTTRDS